MWAPLPMPVTRFPLPSPPSTSSPQVLGKNHLGCTNEEEEEAGGVGGGGEEEEEDEEEEDYDHDHDD